MRDYPDDAVERARQGALEWLSENRDGYPRSRAQEDKNQSIRTYELYDDFEAPPIVGYEMLERDGMVKRLKRLERAGQERVHFRLLK